MPEPTIDDLTITWFNDELGKPSATVRYLDVFAGNGVWAEAHPRDVPERVMKILPPTARGAIEGLARALVADAATATP